MALLPSSIQNLIEEFAKLPGVGPKSAERLVFSLLRNSQEELEGFAGNLKSLKSDLKQCKQCFHITTDELCDICKDDKRDKSVVCVVSHPLELVALEKTGKYNGLYHVLHGHISPIDNMGPEDIKLKELETRIKSGTVGAQNFTPDKEAGKIKDKRYEIQDTNNNQEPNSKNQNDDAGIREVIIATNPTLEGEATALHINKILKPFDIKISRIARGLPTGGDLEYADEQTLSLALEGRREL